MPGQNTSHRPVKNTWSRTTLDGLEELGQYEKLGQSVPQQCLAVDHYSLYIDVLTNCHNTELDARTLESTICHFIFPT